MLLTLLILPCFHVTYYNAPTDKVKLNCHFPAPGRTHRQELQDFPDTIQVSLHKNNLPILLRCAENVVPVQAHTLCTV
jgi:hypothetical protein